MATAWQQVGNCFSLSLSDVHFHFLHGNSMTTAWKLLLTFTFLHGNSNLSQDVFFKM
jgi:hypothetical protein